MKIFHLFIVIGLTTLIACSGTKDIRKFKEKDIIISLQKGSCFGKCAVYKFDIYKNKIAVFTGTAHTEKLGVYSKALTEMEIKDLKNEFASIKFFEMKDEYPYDIIDFPQVSIFFKDGKISKKVTGRDGRPKSLTDLQVRLEKIANSPGWKLEIKSEQAPTPEEPQIENVPEVQIDSEIIIEPAPNVSLARWFKKYERYDVRLIKKIAPNLNFWLITYDTSIIKPADFLEMIRQDTEISNAEFNKKLSPREH
ncbi:MAG: hypothetical protein IPM42_04285 [Saprospiraceae bacterium]|nr:hypothetical protein [Saprospiraceae bacterium]